MNYLILDVILYIKPMVNTFQIIAYCLHSIAPISLLCPSNISHDKKITDDCPS